MNDQLVLVTSIPELFDLLLNQEELDRPFVDLQDQALVSELLLYRAARCSAP